MNHSHNHPSATILAARSRFLRRQMMSEDSEIHREPCCGRPGQIGCKLDALYFDFTNSNLVSDPLHEIRISSSIQEFRMNGVEDQYKLQEELIPCPVMVKANPLTNYQKTLERVSTKNVSGILQLLNLNNNHQMEAYFALRRESAKMPLPHSCIDNSDQLLESYVNLKEPRVISSCSQNGDPLEAYMTFKEERKKKKSTKVEHCVFCKNNGEDISLYSNHNLKDESGRVSCPVLRNYTCPLCGANGDNAHTVRYCPHGTSNPVIIIK